MGKTKVLANNLARRGREAQEKVKVEEGCEVEILRAGHAVAYLGRQLSLTDFHDVEIENRVNRGWAKFYTHKKELCDKAYPLHDRLRLFEAVVRSSVLYGGGSWTITAVREQRLRVAQRRMLRWMVRIGRCKCSEIGG